MVWPRRKIYSTLFLDGWVVAPPTSCGNTEFVYFYGPKDSIIGEQSKNKQKNRIVCNYWVGLHPSSVIFDAILWPTKLGIGSAYMQYHHVNHPSSCNQSLHEKSISHWLLMNGGNQRQKVMARTDDNRLDINQPFSSRVHVDDWVELPMVRSLGIPRSRLSPKPWVRGARIRSSICLEGRVSTKTTTVIDDGSV